MKIIHGLLASVLIASSFISSAQDTPTQEQVTSDNTAFISDDLFIYMHAGPGTNYRILGSINSGDEVQLTGEENNNYTQIIDSKGRTTWVESKYVSTKPGLRMVIAELNGKLAESEEEVQQLQEQKGGIGLEVLKLTEENEQLKQSVSALNLQLEQTKAQLSTQDLELKKEYFYNGAIVLGIGLLFGLILPRLSFRKRSSMESWK